MLGEMRVLTPSQDRERECSFNMYDASLWCIAIRSSRPVAIKRQALSLRQARQYVYMYALCIFIYLFFAVN